MEQLHSNTVTRIGGDHTPPSEAACLFGLASHSTGHSSSSSLRPALERDRPDDHLVVDGSQGSADEGADPEDPLQTMIGTGTRLYQLFGIDRRLNVR